MRWDLGLSGLAYLLGMSLVFGLFAHLAASRVTTKWIGLIATAGFFVLGLYISEGLFGWATEADLQPNIDGLSRDEVLLGFIPGIIAVLFARRWGVLQRGHRSPGAPKAA
jgi:hypothetical protein